MRNRGRSRRRLIPQVIALESKISLSGALDAFGPNDPYNPFPVAQYGQVILPSDPNDTDGNGVPDDTEGDAQDYTPPDFDPPVEVDPSIVPHSQDPVPQEPEPPDFDGDQPPARYLPPIPIGPAGPALSVNVDDPFSPAGPAQEPSFGEFDKDQPPGVDLPPIPIGPAGPAL